MIAQAVFRAVLLLSAVVQHSRYPDATVGVLVRPPGEGECSDGTWHNEELRPCDVPGTVNVFATYGDLPQGAWILYRPESHK
jgi:hypothetical protein